MTNEEAIEVIKAYRDNLTNSTSNQLDGDIKAFDMAISAMLENEELSKDLDEALKEIDEYEQGLEQEPICDRDCEHCTWTECPIEPCDDAISRDVVLKIIDGWYEQNRDTENIEDLIILITYMSSVTQKSGVESRESEKVNCKSTKCDNCINHNYCDFEPQESEDKTNEYTKHGRNDRRV